MLIKAARYAGVGAWELHDRPAAWLNLYTAAEAAEIRAHNYLERRAARKNRGRRRP